MGGGWAAEARDFASLPLQPCRGGAYPVHRVSQTQKQLLYALGLAVVIGIVGRIVALYVNTDPALAPLFYIGTAVAAAIGGITVVGGGGASLGGVIDAIRRASAGERPSPPSGASGELARAYEEIAALADHRRSETKELASLSDLRRSEAKELGKRKDELAHAERALEDLTGKLGEGVTLQASAAEETSRGIRAAPTASARSRSTWKR